jgi:gamma-glutamyl:cysteine ligase YbdK (ATP-grasp superfamily)
VRWEKSANGWMMASTAEHQITRMFPAPLTSFAPTYMASSASGPYAGCSDVGSSSVRL